MSWLPRRARVVGADARGLGLSYARSYLFRLPLFTRCVIAIISIAWALSFQSVWDVQKWAALVPDQISLASAYRTNTYPFVHLGLWHALLNILTLTPLLERFEAEYGTLTSVALFVGPLTTFPAFLYIIVERFILRGNVTIMGASIWVFLLVGMEAVRSSKSSPYIVIGSRHVPTWTTPLLASLVVAVLVPGSSLLGHLCAIVVGYASGLGYLKFLSPPEKILRWIETRLDLLSRLPHYVSVDKKTYGRFGVLPSTNNPGAESARGGLVGGGGQRLGP